jgi:class 3 adenylate cyclase/tetratricopeptide (TPR) repeat protein
MNLRGGTWTILFTDLVGSTEQRARLGDDTGDALRREHDEIVRRYAAAHTGEVVKGTGDGAMVAFAGAADAIRAAVGIQQAVERRNHARLEPIRLRAGLSLGDVVAEDGDLHGLAAVEAARLCALAEPGQVLISDVVRAVAGSRAEHEMLPLGSFELKGLKEPMTVWRVAWSSTPVARPELPLSLRPNGTLPFTGRGDTIDSLLQTWKAVTAGERRAALISGEPGIGKTRLAVELASRVYDDRALVLYGRCDSDFGVPFQPFHEALDWYCDHAEAPLFGAFPADLARLSAKVAIATDPSSTTSQSSDPEVEQRQLFDAMASWLCETAQEAPVLLVLDDLHWASQPTLAMMRHLLRDARLQRVFVAGTFRDTDVDRAHPFATVLAEFHTIPGVDRIELDGLSESEIGELLVNIDAQADAAYRQTLLTQTAGNPFFLGELLREVGASGSTDLPTGVREVVGVRVARLGGIAVDVLRIAATIGAEFDATSLCMLADHDDDHVLDALEAALRARLIDEADGERYRFAHALVRAVVLEEISAARRLRLHRRIAEVLESRQFPPPVVAHHWIEAGPAGDSERTIGAATAAGDWSMDHLAFGDAVLQYESALELSEGNGATPEARCELLDRLGTAYTAAGDYTSARATYVRCGQVARNASLTRWTVRAALSLVKPRQTRMRMSGDDETELLRAAQDAGAAEDDATRSILAARLAALLNEGSIERMELGTKALTLAESSGDPSALRLAYVEQASHLFTAERLAEQRRIAAQAVELARRIGDADALFEALVVQAIPTAMSGQFDALEEIRAEMERKATSVGNRYYEALALLMSASRHTREGRLGDVDDICTAALELCKEDELVQAWSVVLFQSRLFAGRLGDLAPAMHRSQRSGWTGDDSWALARILMLCHIGELDEARTEHARHASDLRWLSPLGTRARLLELSLLTENAALLGSQEGAEEIHADLSDWDGLHVYGSLMLDNGPFSMYLGMLERVMHRYDDAEQHLFDAISACDRHGTVPLGGLARAELMCTVEARGAPGDEARAAQLRTELETMARDLGLHGITRHAEIVTNSSKSV